MFDRIREIYEKCWNAVRNGFISTLFPPASTSLGQNLELNLLLLYFMDYWFSLKYGCFNISNVTWDMVLICISVLLNRIYIIRYVWKVSTLNIYLQSYVYYLIIFDQKTLLIALQNQMLNVSRIRLYREVLWNNRICILILITLFADPGPCDTMIICSGRKRRQWAFISSV